MTEWTFQYNAFINSIDEFSIEHGDDDFAFAWMYTQKMVQAHGLALGGDAPETESVAIAWSQFEDTFDDDEDGAVISLAGIIANLVGAVPIGKNAEFHRALEIGFARARGFSKEDAIQQHEKWIAEHDADYFPLDRSIAIVDNELEDEKPSTRDLRSRFTLIEGGQLEP